MFGSLFRRKKKNNLNGRTAGYESTTEFVDDNLSDVKALLSSVGYYDLVKRLEDISQMTHCHIIILCQKLQTQNKFMVVESTDRTVCQRGTSFSWTHIQPAASAEAPSVVAALPFDIAGGTGFISVPIKNGRDMLSGVLIGISTERIADVDSKTRLMHILAPSFEPEIRCWKLKHDIRQMEQRIASLNQNVEVRSADLQRAQELSLESKELKNTFMMNLSHEIRTPMNVIIGFIDLLTSAEDPNERKEFAEIVKRNSKQMLCVIDNMIEISKLQSSYMLKPASPVQLNELLTSIKEKYQGVLKDMGKDVIIETQFALEAPNDTIWNSDEIIRKVMEQLMDNACRLTQSGRISISYTMNHKDATFCVTDTGPGIKPGQEKTIFNLFDTNTDSLYNSRGKGIGLALAKKYVSLANGQIWVDPMYHEGACFYFSIPTEKL